MTMIQSTDCFHQVHIECLKEKTIELKSENKNVNCPKCGKNIQDFELKQYLEKQQLDEIDKRVLMQIVKENDAMVSCSCGNIIEMAPGEV